VTYDDWKCTPPADPFSSEAIEQAERDELEYQAARALVNRLRERADRALHAAILAEEEERLP
jgi:predicted N-acetyltransferase YhbS